jgi:hypothetical protein
MLRRLGTASLHTANPHQIAVTWCKPASNASNSSVKTKSLPNQSGSIWTTRPSGSLTRKVLTSRQHSC